MSSVVISGDTSGAVTLSAPAVAGTVTVTLPATSGTMLTTASSTGISGSAISSGTVPEAYGGTGTSTGYYGFKNRIINGAMVISQYNGTSSVTPTTNQYTLDRWRSLAGGANSKYSVQQNAGSVTPPVGFTNYFGVTSLSAYSVSSGDYQGLVQKIEGYNVADLAWGTANAKTITLSFWVRSSLTGTFGGAIQNGNSDRSYPFTYTISVANTWEYKSVTIAGDTTGTWFTDNSIGIQVNFGLGVGSTYSGTAGAWSGSQFFSATGATSVVGTNGATFYITGVQLEKGSTATSFDYRPYGTELALCQRYVYAISPPANAEGTIGIGTGYDGTRVNLLFSLPVPLRTAPTISVTGTWLYISFGASSQTSSTAPTLGDGSGSSTNITQIRLFCTNLTSITAGESYWCLVNRGTQLLLTAEL